ncbi:2908_t:CDS:1, partial [Cetraspora pellucida]
MTTQIIPTENSGSNTPILQTPSQTQTPQSTPTQTPQPPRTQTPQPPRTQTPDSVVSTYTLQQKQSIIASTAKLEEILKNKNNEIKTWKDNYNTLLQQLGSIGPT